MGSRRRSIRLRIYSLVAIPLVTMLGLFGYVAYTSVTNWLNLDRAPQLIQSTSEPLTSFVRYLQAERRAALVYLSQPDAANKVAFQAAALNTGQQELKLQSTLSSSATTSNSTPAETAAIDKMVADVGGMTGLRNSVASDTITPIDAFAAYTKVITDQDAIFEAMASSLTDTEASSQGIGLVAAVNELEDVSEQDALLAGALAGNNLGQAERVAFSQAAGRQQDDTLSFQALLNGPDLQMYNKVMAAKVPAVVTSDITEVQQGVAAGLPLSYLESKGLSPATWQELTSTWQTGDYAAAVATANTTLSVSQDLAVGAKHRVLVVGVLGAAGLLLTLLVTILLGRSINRRLGTLRRSALTLAHEQLPSVVARLRRGEPVDVAAEAPPLRVGSDEIGQVGQAIDTVRQTAIRSAVEEARVRQGVNDMFRNLARRNQSLLQRQLTVLDDMERRATDPDVLEDLFKMDHLTTRMRRHAEGLIILSGAPPGRSWSAPVKLIDVMRGAVSEVEDYARVTVATQSRAALAGSAVTDVIHLLAELIENATTLSPPFTQVRVSGEVVANGFAIEIEDRGLGMTPQRFAELNDRLAHPPDINPANTDQLGLFVVGQLARRHRIAVALRPSPYGGTTAVALIPGVLIVAEGPAALTAGNPALNGANWTNSAMAGGYASTAGYPGGADSPVGGYSTAWSGADSDWSRPAAWPGANGAPPSPATTPVAPVADGASVYDAGGSTIRISGALRHPGGGTGTGSTPSDAGARTADGNGSRRGRHGSSDVPIVTGVPVTRPTAQQSPQFDVFTPIRRPGQDGGPPVGQPDVSYDTSFEAAYDAPYAQSYPDFGGDAPEVGQAAYDAASSEQGDGGYPGGDPAAGDINGLPRRVRQANLAPELRSSAAGPAGPAGPAGSAGVPPASAASLTDMRNTLSAMQRGWQQGRSQSPQDTEGSVDGN